MLASVALVASLVKSKAVPTNSPHQKVDLSPDLVKAVTAELIKESSDSSSTAESQATIVDEDQTILLESRVKDALEYIFSTQNARLINANHAIGYVAYGLSDLIFLYPGLTGNDYLGQELKEYGQVRNAKNELVKLVQMDTRFGALQAVQGALAQDPTKRLTVLTSSNALLSMVPNLYALAAQRQPIVFHVAAQSIDQDLVVSPNVDAVLAAARNTGAILLSSSSAQEAHDMAIAAHQIAYSARLPVIHFFNGVSASKQIEKVNLTSYTHLAQLEAIKDIQGPYQVAQKALGQYKPFEYVGASDADTVLVTLRASASDSLQHAVGSTLAKVGLLNVRLFRPWSESDLIHALPKTTRRLVILEEGAGLYAFNGPLYQDVAASIRFGPLAHDQRPRLVSAQAATFDHLQAAHMVPLVKAAEHETFINLAAEPFVQSDEDIILDGAWSAVFWDLEQDGSVPAAAAHLSSHGHVKARTTRDGYHVGGPVVHTHVQAGPASKHQYIAIHNVSLVKEYDTLANAAKNPTVVLHGPWKHGDELEPVLTNEFKLKLTELNAKLYTIDAARIAQDLGLNVKSTHLVWEAVYLILHQKAKNPVEQLTRVYKEPGEKKVALVALLNDLVNAVTNELAAVELLPPWTILEINDTVLPSVPLNRLVVEPVEQQDLGRGEEEQEGEGAESGKWHKAAWQLMFNEAYKTEQAVRPDLHEKTYVIKVMVNKRLTPTSYDRNVFHLEFDTTGSNLRYELGDALGVHGHNDYQDVQAFLDWYGLDGNDVISIKHPESGNQESRTIFQLFAQTLDIFGRPSKKFYESLASFATDPAEREQLLYLVSPEGKEDFKQRVDDTTTYEDLLREFSSAKPSVEDLVRLVAPIKPRHYSIASSQKMYNNAVHLLVVAVDWETKNGKKRYGQCTRYLSNLAIGDQVTVSIKPSVMKLPPLDSQPVIMAGLGTGMAPFRAFIQERYLAKAAGKKIGPVVLYFGSRHRSMEYLYGEELEAYHADGTLSHMGLAFSRDQKEKIYIQHKMKEDADILADYLLNQKGHFYLCGPTWPVPDVKDAVVHGLVKFGGVDAAKASALIEEWKEKETYILEVY
ncbi:Putative Sulfite reductase flavoprotein component [Rhizopus microsporus]|nr:Putative Sulfite reductase flavoprotein component [Rhizopus microsporus]